MTPEPLGSQGTNVKRLTNQTILALKGQGSRYDIPDEGGVPGLSVRVTPNGRKTWAFRYRNQLGKQRRITLGQFGNRAGVGLKDAREMARRILADVSRGDDPAKEKQDARKAEQTREVKTMNDLWQSYRIRKGEAKKSADRELDLWDRHIGPALGQLDIGEISKSQIIRYVHSIGDGINGRQITANRSFALIRQVLNFAVSLDYMPLSPMTGLKMPYKEKPRDRFLSDEEIPIFWNGIDDVTNLSPPVKIALKLALVTGQRRSEIAYISKSELDLDNRIWSLPKERTKNSRPHDVPLSDLAVSLIEEAISHSGYSEYLFRSPRFKDRPIDCKVLTRAWGRARVQLGLDEVVLHDFRRTCATGLQKLGVRLEVTEAVLNHKSGSVSGIVAIYQRHDWKEEKRKALDMWAERVQSFSGASFRGRIGDEPNR